MIRKHIEPWTVDSEIKLVLPLVVQQISDAADDLVNVLASSVPLAELRENVRENPDQVRLLSDGDESPAVEPVLHFKTPVERIGKSRLPGSGRPDDGDNLEISAAFSVHDNLGKLLYRPLEAD